MSTETKIGFAEPADLEFVRTGAKWPYTFWQRDDESARDADYEEDGRWWDCGREDGGDGPQTWDYVSSLPGLKLMTFTAPDPVALEEWPEELLNARVQFWLCPVDHETRFHGGFPFQTVEWRGDVAYCLEPGCGKTSAEKARP